MTRTWPLMSVSPSRALVDEKCKIVVRNLNPRQPVTLHALYCSEDEDFWEAFGQYVSDENGTVTVAKDASVGGTYKAVEPMGLMWSLQPTPGSRTGLRLRKRNILLPMVYHISVYDGHVGQGFNELSPLATVVTERWYMAPGVRRVDVHEKGIQGTLFIPPGPGPFPAVLDLWGGGGGLVEYRSALLAAHGFVSMALEYVIIDKVTANYVDSSYFETAYQILQNNPLVQRDRLALVGLSFGTTITLSMAAYSKVIKPCCCVCISGSHVVPVNKPLLESFEALPLLTDKMRVEDNQLIWRDMILPIPTDPALKVDVGLIKCPVLLINGDDDQNWATLESSKDIEQMMEKAGNRHLLQVLTYPGTGHLIEPPYTPHHRASNFILHYNKEKVIMLWGGQTKPHADAQEDSWEKILAFLHHHLYYAASPSQKNTCSWQEWLLFIADHEGAIVQMVLGNNTLRLQEIQAAVIADHTTYLKIHSVTLSTEISLYTGKKSLYELSTIRLL